MSANDRPQDENSFRSSPTGPRIAPPRNAPRPTAKPWPNYSATYKIPFWSVIIFVLLASHIGIRAYRDLSRPEAWSFWKDQYVSPSLSSTAIGNAGLDGSDHSRRALAITGEIGPAAATWFRTRLNEAKLRPGDVILLSSPGGDLDQAIIMGEEIRSRGLLTGVGAVDASGRMRPASCASACVLIYAGGKIRYGVEGSRLGVHRFVTEGRMEDPVADTQRTAGIILGYMTRMGVSASIVEAMSQTSDVRWLDAKQALAMNLITDPVGKP